MIRGEMGASHSYFPYFLLGISRISFSIISYYFDDSETQYQIIKLKKTTNPTARTGYETQYQKQRTQFYLTHDHLSNLYPKKIHLTLRLIAS